MEAEKKELLDLIAGDSSRRAEVHDAAWEVRALLCIEIQHFTPKLFLQSRVRAAEVEDLQAKLCEARLAQNNAEQEALEAKAETHKVWCRPCSGSSPRRPHF